MMSKEILEKALMATLTPYLQMSDDMLNTQLKHPAVAIKERVVSIDGLQIIIYPNDHLPAHFHVKTKDGSIDAKFTIDDCKYINGPINTKNLKRVEAFAKSPKGQLLLSTIWKKYH